MKTSRKYLAVLLTAVIGLLVTVEVRAQQTMPDIKNSTPEQRAAFQTNLMKTKLNLDAAQLAKVTDVNLRYAQKFQPIIKSDDSRFSKMRQAKALQAQKDKELQAIFTKDQFKQYQDFEQELKSKMMARAQSQ